jgi:hypothetical protein
VAVIDSMGRLTGILTAGAGTGDIDGKKGIVDCTYITSINFICKHMLEHGLKANLFPSLVLSNKL